MGFFLFNERPMSNVLTRGKPFDDRFMLLSAGGSQHRGWVDSRHWGDSHRPLHRFEDQANGEVAERIFVDHSSMRFENWGCFLTWL